MKISILARLDTLPIFATGIDDTGGEIGCASHKKKAAMAIDVSQGGQIEIPRVTQQLIISHALGLRPVGVFRVGVGAQSNDDGGILKQIHRAVQFDGGGTDGAKAAGKEVGQGLVKGKGTAILKDQSVEFTEGLSGFKAQDFHRQLAHDVREGLQEELGCGRFEQLFIEGVIIGVKFPQLIELAMQISDGVDLLGGHGGNHRQAQTTRRDEALALDQSAFFPALIEDLFIQDGLELIGHGGNLLGIHATFLSLIEGVRGVGWILPQISIISRA